MNILRKEHHLQVQKVTPNYIILACNLNNKFDQN